jgi:uncharacterized protein (TIGR02646 family)
MIKLIDQSISQATLDYLAGRQSPINAIGLYSERIAEAKGRWGNFNNAAFREVKEKLIAMCPSTQRCVYCEDSYADEIEHFRPKDLYPDLTFVWENYLLACGRCNGTSKRHHFAIFDATGQFQDITRPAKVVNIFEPPSGENVLINPRYENPLDFLKLDLLSDFEIQIRPRLNERDARRANYTIELLQLNTRAELPQWRKAAFESFMDWLRVFASHTSVGNDERLVQHKEALARKNHIMVWEEMRRFYLERNPSYWETKLKRKYPIVEELDSLFSANPEVLNITFIL